MPSVASTHGAAAFVAQPFQPLAARYKFLYSIKGVRTARARAVGRGLTS